MVRVNRFALFVRNLIFLTRLATPWIWGAFVFTLSLVTTTAISIWVGVPTAVDRIANEWLDRAVIAGFPTQWDRQLYYILWALGLITVVAGWIILSFITVGIVHLIF
jgi:hypothetical protein